MSAQRSWTIYCDGCDATIDAGDLGAETAAAGRAFAKSNGAHVNLLGGKDLCADCWEGGLRG